MVDGEMGYAHPVTVATLGAELFIRRGRLSPFLGRAQQLALLDGVFERAVRFQAPQLVTLVGNQGLGKSRLVMEWLEPLEARAKSKSAAPLRVLRAGAVAGSGSYALIQRLLKNRFGLGESEE